jgi:hypothetical protein
MIGAAPLLAGGCHDSTTERSPCCAVSDRGAEGTACGVAASQFDGGLEPCALRAMILKWYCVPLVSPVTVYVDAEPGTVVDAFTHVDPFVRCTVYMLTAGPPVLDCGCHVNVTLPLPAVADSASGLNGTPVAAAGTADTVFDIGPQPLALWANTRK